MLREQLTFPIKGDRSELIKDPRPKGRGIRRRDGELFLSSGESDVGLAAASDERRKRRGMQLAAIQLTQILSTESHCLRPSCSLPCPSAAMYDPGEFDYLH